MQRDSEDLARRFCFRRGSRKREREVGRNGTRVKLFGEEEQLRLTGKHLPLPASKQ